jgi:biotin carboxylase
MKTIIFLGAGSEQAHVLQFAQELGYKTCVLDSNVNAIGKKFADIFLECDITSTSDILKTVRDVSADGIFVHAIELSYVVSIVSEKLGLRGIKPEAAINSTNKLKRLEIFKKNNIPCVNFGSTNNINDAKKFAQDIGYPVVIKPVDNAGSRGVILVQNKLNLEKYFDESLSYCKNEKLVLIEEYLQGSQISSETVIHKEKMFTTGFSDRNYENMEKYQPYFVEDGGDMPTKINSRLKSKTIETIEKSISSLGLDFGAAKGDLLIHNDTPMVIEMASRTSGGRFATHQVPMSTGVNILKPLLQMTCGDPIDENDFIPKFNRGCSQRYIIPKPGKIIKVEGIEEAKKLPGVKSVIIDKDISIGVIIPDTENNATRIGVVMADGNTRDEAKYNAIKARNLIKIITSPL